VVTNSIRVSPEKVDGNLAREVASVMICARSNQRDPKVRAAYEELQRQSDAIFVRLSRTPVRCGGVEVRFTRCEQPYDSDDELVRAVRTGGVLEVTTSAKDRDRRHPLLDREVGGAHDRFRAVHDVVGHAWPRLGFDRDGEFGAWLFQERFYHGLARWALTTELHAQHSVRWTTGDLSDHKAILIDRGLLDRVRSKN
jgi:hypothetical protein